MKKISVILIALFFIMPCLSCAATVDYMVNQIKIETGYYKYYSDKNVHIFTNKPIVFRYTSESTTQGSALVASYDEEGKLIDIQSADININSPSDDVWVWITPTEETHKIRAFAWDGVSSMIPMSEMVEIGRPTLPSPQGSGTEENPYMINSVKELEYIKYTNEAFCKLGEDIDMSGIVWEPFEFVGTFDGAGHKISNISVSDSAKFSGLFSLIDEQAYVVEGTPVGGISSIVKNLEVEISHSSDSAAAAGGICATGYNANIDNCIVRGEISAKEIGDGLNYQESGMAGGIMTNQHGGTTSNCKSYANVSVTSDKNAMVGGIVGNMSGYVNFKHPTISDCESYGRVSARGADGTTVYAGGIAGFGILPGDTQMTGKGAGVKNCKSYATIFSNGILGGICAFPDVDWTAYGKY